MSIKTKNKTCKNHHAIISSILLILKEVYELESKDSYLQQEYLDVNNPAVNNDISVGYLFVKRFLDIILSLCGIILLSPLLLTVAAVVKTTSKGPVIYKQERMGKSGETFRIYKFRSMFAGAENLSNFLEPETIEFYKKNRKIPNDPRVTKIGNFLRMSSIDELPQLFNIFKGDMSIVGPRPLLKDEISRYGILYRKYITLRPGLTGLWQVSGRSETSFEERVIFDRRYIKELSLHNDIAIIFRTFGAVISKKGAC